MGFLRKVFVPKREEVTGGWKNVRDKELHDVYSSPGMRPVRVTESLGMRWTGRVPRVAG